MNELLPYLKAHFDTLQDRLICFCELGIQTEGWLKGEILTLFCQLRRDKHLPEFDREVKVGSQKIDLTARLQNEQHWIELKHWLIGRQRGYLYNAGFYFGDRSSVGIIKDVEKLNTITFPTYRWLLLLLTANPGAEQWKAGIANFNLKFAPHRISARTCLDDYPSTYFLGLLEVGRE